MSGVAVIVSLLKASTDITTIVPTARIRAGELPLLTPLPAISVTQISSEPMNFIDPNETPKMHLDRVQVSVLCKEGGTTGTGYPGVKALLILALAACSNRRGTVNGITVDSIVPDIEGPDFYDQVDAIHSGSRDFLVRRLA